MEARLKHNRPNLSASSIKTYLSILKNLFKKMDGKGDEIELFVNHPEKVMTFLKDKPGALRKTTLATLVSLSGDAKAADKYREVMLSDAHKYNDEQRNQEPTEKQQKNWISWEDVMKIYNRMYKSAYPLFSKEHLTKKEFETLQDFVMLSCYTLIPVRRSLDFVNFKLRNIDKDEDNYMDKSSFVFNSYKTKKNYGQQRVKIPTKLHIIIKKWMLKNKNDYLLVDRNGNKLTVSRLALRLNNIFGGKNISTSMLRHSYISDVVLKNAPALKKLDEISKDMGQSTAQQSLYKKIIPSSSSGDEK